jgi:hypothetical protein
MTDRSASFCPLDQTLPSTATFHRDMAELNPTQSSPVQIDRSVKVHQLLLGLRIAGLSLKRDELTGIYLITH